MTDILNQIDAAVFAHESMQRNERRFHLSAEGEIEQTGIKPVEVGVGGGSAMRWRPHEAVTPGWVDPTVKSSIEEVSEPAEAAPLLPLDSVTSTSPVMLRRAPEARRAFLAEQRARHVANGAPEAWLEAFDTLAATTVAASEVGGNAPICRGCRAAPRADGLLVCIACMHATPCGNERTNAISGRHMTCIRPAGHQPPCEEGHPAGSQWVAQTFADLQAEQGVTGRVDPDSLRIDGLALRHPVSRAEIERLWEQLSEGEPDEDVDLDEFFADNLRSMADQHATPVVDAALDPSPDAAINSSASSRLGWVRLREMFRRDR